MRQPVRCGVDVLAAERCVSLHGRRIGLITNHTGVTRELHPTLDLLATTPEVLLLTLFSPEHGIRGDVDAPVADGVDGKTGLPIHSLYGARTRPTAEQLHGLDTLVYDIQDVGARFYTFITTLGQCMEAAAEHGLRFVVLDRPNPIGGVAIEGPIADADSLDFTAYHTLPVRHGLTVGELARLFATEKRLNLELHVVKAEHWTRDMWWDETNLTWINPSPNMRSETQALLYPGIGLLEFTNVSVGRGTDTPFEHIGAPWIRERELAGALNDRGLPGVRFVPVRFTPTSSTHARAACGGINFVITERARFHPLLTGFAVAEALLRLFPQDWNHERYARLLVNSAAFAALVSGATAESILQRCKPDLARFEERRKPILLYAAGRQSAG
ncbi:MAG TPA: DUF1343 domain-containing protein [Chthonomonadaceae bacterium]|nr:DUF1343 domain-containing protein [Chthonomonadaceae bacterium]